MNLTFKIARSKSGRTLGFAMLFAVLASSLVLSIGISIFNLTIRGLTLASTERESQFAFYAADSGIECALYWDFQGPYPYLFATSSQSQSGNWRDSYVDAISPSPSCAGVSIVSAMKTPTSNTGSPPPTIAGSATSQFTLTFSPENYCAVITIQKTVDVSGEISVYIVSRGYNTCDTADPTRVERALNVRYTDYIPS